MIATSTENLKFGCCEELNVKFNISAVSLNTGFKHIVSHLEDLKVADQRISDVKKCDQGARVQKSAYIISHMYSAFVYFRLIFTWLYIIYKL